VVEGLLVVPRQASNREVWWACLCSSTWLSGGTVDEWCRSSRRPGLRPYGAALAAGAYFPAARVAFTWSAVTGLPWLPHELRSWLAMSAMSASFNVAANGGIGLA